MLTKPGMVSGLEFGAALCASSDRDAGSEAMRAAKNASIVANILSGDTSEGGNTPAPKNTSHARV